MSIQRERFGSLLAELQGITSLRDHQELERQSDELRKKGNKHSAQTNLAKLGDGINSLAISLGSLETEPNEPFYIMAWPVVHQIAKLEGNVNNLFSDVEYGSLKANSSVQSSTSISY
jgi:hypothetical protein